MVDLNEGARKNNSIDCTYNIVVNKLGKIKQWMRLPRDPSTASSVHDPLALCESPVDYPITRDLNLCLDLSLYSNSNGLSEGGSFHGSKYVLSHICVYWLRHVLQLAGSLVARILPGPLS